MVARQRVKALLIFFFFFFFFNLARSSCSSMVRVSDRRYGVRGFHSQRFHHPLPSNHPLGAYVGGELFLYLTSLPTTTFIFHEKRRLVWKSGKDWHAKTGMFTSGFLPWLKNVACLSSLFTSFTHGCTFWLSLSVFLVISDDEVHSKCEWTLRDASSYLQSRTYLAS